MGRTAAQMRQLEEGGAGGEVEGVFAAAGFRPYLLRLKVAEETYMARGVWVVEGVVGGFEGFWGSGFFPEGG